jgi:hypothetical protein
MTGFFNNAGPSPVEDRLRAALHAHAEDFTAGLDAWQQLQARTQGTASRTIGSEAAGSRAAGSRAGGSRAGGGSPARRLVRGRLAVPAAAAAAVVAVVVAATTLVHGLGGPPAAGHGSASSARPEPRPTATGPNVKTFPDQSELTLVPPTTSILSLTTGKDHASGTFWFGYNSPGFWGYEVSPGLQFCDAVGSADAAETSCIPVTALRAASVTAGSSLGLVSVGATTSPSAIYAGSVTDQAASVTAVLPDGRTYAGVVGTARGFPDKAWIVDSPQVTGTRLIFRDASGHQIADASTALVQVPAPKQPHSGAITLLHYSGGGASGSVLAYLVGGHVAFWLGEPWPTAVSPDAAAGQPALAGMADIAPTGSRQYPVVALGYAHADVARIVVHLPHGKQVTVRTFLPGWPGSGLRLWKAALGTGLFNDKAGMPLGLPTLTATAYDAAGHVVAQVRLGFSNFPI